MTLRQKAYQAIKNKIIYFELKPGDKVLESHMARLLNMGRVPVREALTMLESERLIIKTQGYGYLVTRIKSKEVEDYFNIRTELECFGALLLLKRATEADLKRMRAHLDKARVIYMQQDIRKIIQSDTKFHEMMYLATKSDVFYQAISSLADKTIILRAAALHTSEGREASLKDHLEIMHAIGQKKPDRLHNLIVEHMKYAPRYYETIRPIISF
jgi:DNA-binding GntR family transcriptional regulator